MVDISDIENFQDVDEESGNTSFLNRRVKTPTIIQMEVTECGAVSLGIILAHYGKFLPIETLRVACNVTRDGSSAWNIVEAAKSFGLEAHGYQVDVDEIKTVSLPAIVYWQFEHFVVLEGFDTKNYYINDPGTGPRQLSSKEFEEAFSGIVLELSPGEHFVKSGNPPTPFTFLWRQLIRVKAPISFLFVTELILLIPFLLLPAFSQVFVDRVLDYGDVSLAWGLLAVSAVGTLLTAGVLFMQEKMFIYLRAKLSLGMSSRAIWQMLRLPIPFFTHRYAGEVAYRMALVDPIVESLTGQLATTALDCLLVAVYGAALVYYSPPMAMVTFCAGGVNCVLLFSIFRMRQDTLGRFQAAIGKSTSFALGMLENIETIKGMGMEAHYFSRWAGYYTKVANVFQSLGKKDLFLGIFPALIHTLTLAFLVGIGGAQLLNGTMTPGMFLSLQILVASFMVPLLRLISFSQVIQLLKVNLFRLGDLMEYPLAEEFLAAKASKNAFETYRKWQGDVQVKNVAYGYSRLGPPLFENVTFRVKPGQTAAIVGASGCGKSTLMAMIAGLIAPWKGAVLFDGAPRNAWQRQQLTNSLAMVEQSPFLFKGTIRDNLSFYNFDISEEELDRATQDACIYGDIVARKGGYDFEIENNGTNFSGGQRQRLEIARALLKNPSILILDECTSALDPDTEQQVMRNIHRRGCTVVMVAHRLSSIKHCHQIYVLDKGKFVDQGTHEELKKRSPIYMELVSAEEH